MSSRQVAMLLLATAVVSAVVATFGTVALLHGDGASRAGRPTSFVVTAAEIPTASPAGATAGLRPVPAQPTPLPIALEPSASQPPGSPPQPSAPSVTPVPTIPSASPLPLDPFAVVIALAQRDRPAVVTITTSDTSGGGATGIGSGMIVDPRGFILTSDHVVAGAAQMSVVLADGRTFDATVVAGNARLDLAVIKVAGSGLPVVTLGRSASLRVGQLVVAIGDPLGTFPGSVTAGVLSGTGRSIDVGSFGRPQHLTNLLQLDAPINSGNSGGPLLDAQGAVIGISEATDPNAQGVGFAVPIDAARPLLAEALASGA
jgi:S1-C subfamily serine protease